MVCSGLQSPAAGRLAGCSAVLQSRHHAHLSSFRPRSFRTQQQQQAQRSSGRDVQLQVSAGTTIVVVEMGGHRRGLDLAGCVPLAMLGSLQIELAVLSIAASARPRLQISPPGCSHSPPLCVCVPLSQPLLSHPSGGPRQHLAARHHGRVGLHPRHPGLLGRARRGQRGVRRPPAAHAPA